MDVSEFYSGANIFITGGTGFVGICLIEKLLRCIPDIGTIYLLIRQKSKKDLQLRLRDLVNDNIFNLVKEHYGTAPFQKIHGVLGDISKDDLELSPQDENLLINNVNIVFHLAANLDFNDSLRNAININFLGTKRIIELCKRMTNLKALVHVSSAYVNTDLIYVKEIMYPLPRGADKVTRLIENLDDNTISHVMPIILHKSANAYTFTKSLAEREVSSVNELFPTAIVRPSMIVGAWKEPVPGWTGSKNGPQGFLMAAAKGIIRRLPVDKNLIYDYIPVDIVINEVISSAWYVVKNRSQETLILHCTTSTYRPFKWLSIEKHIPELLNTYPLQSAIWYPTLKFVSSMSVYRVSALFFHFIPAYFFDFLARLNGQKPILVKLHKNINRSLETLSPFIFNEWKFDNSNTLMLHGALSESDQTKFGVDVKDLVWKNYFSNLALGVRQYLNNENLDNLKSAKRKNIFLYFLNVFLQMFFLCIVFFIVSACSGTSIFTCLWYIPVFIMILYYV